MLLGTENPAHSPTHSTNHSGWLRGTNGALQMSQLRIKFGKWMFNASATVLRRQRQSKVSKDFL